jgi:MFS family permease
MKRSSGLRDFLLIWSGQLISAIGSRLSIFALGIWVLRSTGSTTEFAMTYLAMDVPVLLISPLAGPLVDRWDRRRLMMACDALCAATTFVLALLFAADALQVWHAYAGVAVLALCSAFHAPALQASIPLLASESQLPRANGLVQTGNAIAAILGPLLAGALVTLISLYGVLAVDAVSFLAGVAGVALARIPRPPRNESEPAQAGVMQEAAAGWRYVHAQRGLFGLLLLDSFKGFVFSIAAVLITPLLLSFTGAAHVGVQYATSGAGLLAGGLAMTALGAPKRRVRRLLGLMALCGLFLAVHGLWPSFALVVGAGFVMFMTLPMMASQLQGRCFAIQQALANAAAPLGYCIAGPLAERVFEPMLRPGGVLAASAGAWIGVGAGRGIGALFVLMGLAMIAAALVASACAAVRGVDDLPDALADAAPAGARPDPATDPAPRPAEPHPAGLAAILASSGAPAE